VYMPPLIEDNQTKPNWCFVREAIFPHHPSM
jgi:hypothetical protein